MSDLEDRGEMLTIGLTGGIASGKSVVAAMFVALGAALVDTDLIAREVVAPGAPGLDAVRKIFGPHVLTESGALDRAAMRELVFHDAKKRHALEAILHPLIRTRMLERIGAAHGAYTIVAVPLLIETEFVRLFDRVLVVDCPETIQIARLTARDPGMAEGEAEVMLAAQTDRSSRLAAADDVIDNSGSLESTRRQVEALHLRYMELAAARAPAS